MVFHTSRRKEPSGVTGGEVNLGHLKMITGRELLEINRISATGLRA